MPGRGPDFVARRDEAGEQEEAANAPLPTRILQRMRTAPAKLWSVAELRPIAPGTADQTIRNSLVRLAERGAVTCPEKGRYTLSDKQLEAELN